MSMDHEIADAEELLKQQVRRLSEMGQPDLAQRLLPLWSELRLYYEDAARVSPVSHTPFVMSNVIQILTPAELALPTGQANVLAGLGHDVGNALCSLPKVTSDEIRAREAAVQCRMRAEGRSSYTDSEHAELSRLVEAAIAFREEHAVRGAEILGEVLSGHGFDQAVILEATRQTRRHDSPSCHGYEAKRPGGTGATSDAFLFPPEDPIWVLRQADRAWMVAAPGIRFELGLQRLAPTPEVVADKVRGNLENHWKEASFYAGKAAYRFIGRTICRTEAAHRLYKELLDLVGREFGADLAGVRKEFGLD